MPLHRRLSNFLLSYRTTLHATTNRTPSELFMERTLHTQLDLLRLPCDRVLRQAKQKTDHDRRAWSRELHIAGVIMQRLGPLTYPVQVDMTVMETSLGSPRVRGDKPESGENT